MKLNPSKCTFGVASGKFNMEPLKNIKDVQSLTGGVAALNRFVSKATD